FYFNKFEFNVNQEFKKKMNPNGKLYSINQSLYEFPSIAAALLKYKKHEWIVVAFEKEKKVELIWLNKGFDRERVSSYLSINEISKIALSNNLSSVLMFHNHPNSNPNFYDCRKPSKLDLKSAHEFASVLNENGFNLIEFVCERGRHYQFFSAFSNSFLPLSGFVTVINESNGLSRLKNISLHIERIF
ncbi:hypothetical protein KKB18_07940, partial [bacterium]|nr:hypothetical protein [bacterium]